MEEQTKKWFSYNNIQKKLLFKKKLYNISLNGKLNFWLNDILLDIEESFFNNFS